MMRRLYTLYPDAHSDIMIYAQQVESTLNASMASNNSSTSASNTVSADLIAVANEGIVCEQLHEFNGAKKLAKESVGWFRQGSSISNAPERFLSWRWEDDDQENRLEYTPDTKIPNAGLFKLHKEDHTMGNLLRMQLLRDHKVRFAAYKIPHPLIHSCHVKVQTLDGRTNPVSAFAGALDDLGREVERIEQQFSRQCEELEKSID